MILQSSLLTKASAVAATAFFLSSAIIGANAAYDEVLWMDDFSASSLDTTKWGYDTSTYAHGWGNQELQVYTESQSNVDVDGGRLLITARRDEYGSGFTSGRIKTEGKMHFTYGRLEASIMVPDSGDGLWPAFWTMGHNFQQVGWPDAGEIDVMEIGQGLGITEGVVNRRVVSGAHWEHEGTYATYADWFDAPQDLHQGFHKYTLDWTPQTLTTYVDDLKIWEMDISSASCTDCEEFHQPHYVLLNLAVGGLFTSIGGEGSSSSASASSSSACTGSSSSAGVASSSSGGCGITPRTDVTAPLPATMLVEYVKLYDNGFTQVDTPGHDNIFEPPTPEPVAAVAPPPQTPEPVAPPTPSPVAAAAPPPPTPELVAPPTPSPVAPAPIAYTTPQPVAPPTPSPVVPAVPPMDLAPPAPPTPKPSMADPWYGAEPAPGISPTPKPSARSPWLGAQPADRVPADPCAGKGKGRGRSGCGKSGKGKGGKGSKGSKSSKSSKTRSSDELFTVKRESQVSSANKHQYGMIMFAASLFGLVLS